MVVVVGCLLLFVWLIVCLFGVVECLCVCLLLVLSSLSCFVVVWLLLSLVFVVGVVVLVVGLLFIVVEGVCVGFRLSVVGCGLLMVLFLGLFVVVVCCCCSVCNVSWIVRLFLGLFR